jgi:hypothetical protein
MRKYCVHEKYISQDSDRFTHLQPHLKQEYDFWMSYVSMYIWVNKYGLVGAWMVCKILFIFNIEEFVKSQCSVNVNIPAR